MGGQQFLTDGSLLDMRRLNRVRELDEERGLLEVEAGITWPDVMRGYLARPNGKTSYCWAFFQFNRTDRGDPRGANFERDSDYDFELITPNFTLGFGPPAEAGDWVYRVHRSLRRR